MMEQPTNETIESRAEELRFKALLIMKNLNMSESYIKELANSMVKFTKKRGDLVTVEMILAQILMLTIIDLGRLETDPLNMDKFSLVVIFDSILQELGSPKAGIRLKEEDLTNLSKERNN